MSLSLRNLPRLLFGLLLALPAGGCSAWWSSGGELTDVDLAHAMRAARSRPPAAASRDVDLRLAAASGAAQDQDLVDVLREVKQLGANDPVAQQRLLDMLQQSKPELWPLVVQQFRSSLAYHQQLVGAETSTPPVATANAAPDSPLPERRKPCVWPGEPSTTVQADFQTPAGQPADPPAPQPVLLTVASEPITPSVTPAPTAAALPQEESKEPNKPDLLELSKLTFCKSVYGYGAYDPYEEARFAAGQQVSIYVELGNYDSEPTDDQYTTKLGTSYQILDEHGERVAAGEFPDVEDVCRSRRRDFHIQYGLVLPDAIAPGKYQLRLAMRDRQSGKVGQGMIAFVIDGDEP